MVKTNFLAIEGQQISAVLFFICPFKPLLIINIYNQFINNLNKLIMAKEKKHPLFNKWGSAIAEIEIISEKIDSLMEGKSKEDLSKEDLEKLCTLLLKREQKAIKGLILFKSFKNYIKEELISKATELPVVGTLISLNKKSITKQLIDVYDNFVEGPVDEDDEDTRMGGGMRDLRDNYLGGISKILNTFNVPEEIEDEEGDC